jgi:hypothetical protein
MIPPVRQSTRQTATRAAAISAVPRQLGLRSANVSVIRPESEVAGCHTRELPWLEQRSTTRQPTEVIVARRMVRKIVLTYSVEGEDTERTVTVTHTEGGQAVDGLILDRKLLNRLFYEDPANNRYRPVDRRPAPRPPEERKWRVEANGGAAAMSSGNDCVWIHDESCNWTEFCSTDPV